MPLNGSCFNKIVQIGLGHSVQDRIIKLKARNTSCDAFEVILSNPKNSMKGQFEQLDLDDHPVQFLPYTTVAEVY